MMLNVLRRSKERRALAARLHAALVARARDPVFFERFGVDDTLDGRFDLVVLHAWLVLERLKAVGTPLSQALVDTVFTDFEEAMREMGAGDIGMVRRVKKLASAFYGRMRAYEGAQDETAIEAALIRNLYRGVTQPGAKALARYVLRAKARLKSCDVESGVLDFGPLPDED
jgi:cytochrome b pre-mRNA-processing protein 3